MFCREPKALQVVSERTTMEDEAPNRNILVPKFRYQFARTSSVLMLPAFTAPSMFKRPMSYRISVILVSQ